MKPNLLNDVLNEGDFPAFREALLIEVERETRRKRSRKFQSLLALAACLALLAGSLFIPTRQPSKIAAKSAPANSLPILRTLPFPAAQIMVTQASPEIILEAAFQPVMAFATDHTKTLPSISDSELLALFPKKPTGVAYTSTGAKRFFFINAADAKQFMSSN